jgi:23S rRNA (guanosine2251-2'-O)-methyltransferase
MGGQLVANNEIIYGVHAVRAALEHPGQVVSLWVQEGRQDRRVQPLIDLALTHHVPVERLPRRRLDDMVPGVAHQGIAALTRSTTGKPGLDIEDVLAGIAVAPLLLVLDGVQDPHNLGACLRTAAAAGVHAVLAPRDRAVGITPVVRKVASGAVEHVPYIQVTNLARALDGMRERGIWVAGLDGTAETPLYNLDLTIPLAMVMGGEGKGLRQLTRRHCDFLAAIPMPGGGESLNVSVATGISLFEAVRQRHNTGHKSQVSGRKSGKNQ